MKSFLSLFALVFLFAGTAFSDESVVGNYYQHVNGQWESVAKVYSHAGQLKVKFDRGCTAELEKKSDSWLGTCSTGRGFAQTSYSVRVVQKSGNATLAFRISEYGNEELGFGEAQFAVRK